MVGARGFEPPTLWSQTMNIALQFSTLTVKQQHFRLETARAPITPVKLFGRVMSRSPIVVLAAKLGESRSLRRPGRMISELRHDASAYAEWFRLLAGAADDHPGEVFASEFAEWFIGKGELLNGQPLDTDDHQQSDQFYEVYDRTIHLAKQAKLVSVEHLVPYRLHPDAMLRRLPEQAFKLTKKGRRISQWPEWALSAYLGFQLAIALSVPLFAKLKLPLTLISLGMTTSKVVFQWDTIVAGVAVIISAGIAAVAVAAGSTQ